MEKVLIIVESPTKIKTISKYLGKEYRLASTVGHFRQIRKKNNAVSWDGSHFSFEWELDKKKFQAIEKEISKNVQQIMIATDPDREGEAIGWHLESLLKYHRIPIKRIQFHEITKKAVVEAIKHPRAINQNLVEAYFTRIGLDYTIGFTLSPLLWSKMPLQNASAGRVQTPTLGFLIEREIERINFKSTLYYQIVVFLKIDSEYDLETQVTQYKDQKISSKLQDEKLAKEINENVPDKFKVKSVTSKIVTLSPPMPFITSSLQQEASKMLGIKIHRVMQLAQNLYEGLDIDGTSTALITYMRTDSMNMSEDIIKDIRSFLSIDYGNDIPAKPNRFQNKAKNIQEAHECIRPVNININPQSIKNKISEEHYKLYNLIWSRSIACQMNAAKREQSTYIFEAPDYELKYTNSTIKYKGYLHFYNNCSDRESLDLKEGEILNKKSNKLHIQETKPPAKYTESTLLNKMEEEGIGRPSTYVSTITTLVKREFISESGKQLSPTIKGFLVYLFMNNNFNKFIQTSFTSYIEQILDDITNEGNKHVDIIDNLIKELKVTAADIKENMFGVIGDKLVHIFNRSCTECGEVFQLRYKYDFFLHCKKCNKNIPFYPPTENELDEYTKLVKFPQSKISYLIHKDKKIYIPEKVNLTTLNYKLLLDLPRVPFEIDGEDVTLGITKYGLFMKYKEKYKSITMDQLESLNKKNFKEIYNQKEE